MGVSLMLQLSDHVVSTSFKVQHQTRSSLSFT